jgi:hypothetical protein
MAEPVTQTKVYHLINCEPFRDISIQLSEKGRQNQAAYSILGLSSKETIGASIKAIRRSPFKTVFVVDESTGHPIFAITQNEEYVEFAKKRNPAPPPPPPPPSDCCQRCFREGGTSCFTYPDGSCFCVGRDGTTDDPLDSVPPPGI